jgi:hypothetical protein
MKQFYFLFWPKKSLFKIDIFWEHIDNAQNNSKKDTSQNEHV